MTTKNTEKQPSLLVVDDDRHLLESMGGWLADQGFQVFLADCCETAQSIANENQIDLALVDVRLKDEDGIDLLKYFRKNYPKVTVVLMTGYATVETGVEAIRLGAFDLLTKPLIDEELLMAIDRALNQRQVIEENKQLKAQLDTKFGLDNIVGNHPQMKKTFEIIESVAETKATILITGESGTGKSLIARAIHRRSDRCDGPFIEVACGALPENLLESEFFGHVAGSFTGATGDKEGKFKQADGGTIFLDEIGTASPGLQVKLLRVLQEFQFEQVGGSKTFSVNTRVILATNEDLIKSVAEGTFREDLYYRINVINLELPSLGERSSDIPSLAEHFLGRIVKETGKEIDGFDRPALTAMQNYGWPGNVRELQNVIERAVLLGKGPLITLQDLPGNIASGAKAGNQVVTSNKQQTLKEALEGPERQIILQVLRENDWNRNLTADQLGINRTTLYKKMKKLGLENIESKMSL